MAGRPFVLLGVNTDEDRQEIKSVIAKQNLNWRSWWDGGSTEGPIVKQWQIGTWPTLYVIDDKGLVRYIENQGGGVDIEPLEAALEKLVRSAETTQSKFDP